MEFSEDFFKREVREGFEISEMMKRAWAAQMEVLQVVIDICNKNELQYFADWGTLLGAVRHKGFIPWDDDIDICLKREDYVRLMKILPTELPHGLVVTGMYASTKRLQLAGEVSQLRVIADETIWNFNDYMKRFHGFPYQRVGVDIFPLDYIPRDEEAAEIQKTMYQQGMDILTNWNELELEGALEKVLKEYAKLCNIQIEMNCDVKNYIWKVTDAIAALYRREEADYLTNYTFWVKKDTYKMKKEWYDQVVMLPFENIEIAAPAMYHEVLSAQFGDYMVPIKGAADHDYPFYGHMEGELKKQIKTVGFEGSIEEFCQMVSSGTLRV